MPMSITLVWHGDHRPAAGVPGLSRRHHRPAELAVKDDFMKLGEPNLFFGVAAGNMDSMINRYTADKKIRSDDALHPGGMAASARIAPAWCTASAAKKPTKRADRAPAAASRPPCAASLTTTIGETACVSSILIDASADILLYGNAERAIVEVAQRLSYGQKVEDITDVRGTAFIRRDTPAGWCGVDSTRIDRPGRSIDKIINPYVNTQDTQACAIEQEKVR